MKIFGGLMIAAVLVGLSMAVPFEMIGTAHAQAAGTALAQTDGGAQVAAYVGKGKSIDVQCREPACLRLVAASTYATAAASCVTDAQVRGYTATGSGVDFAGVQRGPPLHIETGALTLITARIPDAGNPGCIWYEVPRNP